jgi:hypothetical protein
MNYQFSAVFFFSLLDDTSLIFRTLLCHTKLQIKFEFGFGPLAFQKPYGPWTYKNMFSTLYSRLPTLTKETIGLPSVCLTVIPLFSLHGMDIFN